MKDKLFFFGCWTNLGHHLFNTRAISVSADRAGLPWAEPDMDQCPGWRKSKDVNFPEDQQIEGRAKLHHKDGWTALAWWDRSVDHRYGSNAGLYAQGTFTADEMIQLGQTYFPHVFVRFTYEIGVDKQ